MLNFYPPTKTLLLNTLVLCVFANSSAQIGDLIWEDDFNSFDESIWNPIEGNGCEIGLCGWGNAELEYYRSNNITIEPILQEENNNALVLTAQREAFGGSDFTSGKIDSENNLSVQYGMIEIRMKTPNLDTGLWPAAWLLGTSNLTWPAKGEIDMMEMGHSADERTNQGHPNSNINSYVGANAIFANEDGSAGSIAYDTDYNKPYEAETPMDDRYVIYRLYWDENEMRYTVIDNGQEYDLYESSLSLSADDVTGTFQKPFYFLLNLAVGGNFTDASQESEVSATLPAKLYIDYVRVYEWNGQGSVEFDYGELIAQNGTFGVFTENTETQNQLNFGIDAEISSWQNTLVETTGDASEGSEVLAWETQTAASWFGFGIAPNYGANMSNYVENGNLKFDIKIPADVNFKIGISDNYSNESFLEFPANEAKYDLVRNGEWGTVTIPLSDFAGLIAFQNINNMFSLASVDGNFPSSIFEFAVDNIYWEDNSDTDTTLNNDSFDVLRNNRSIYPMPASDHVLVNIPKTNEHTIVQIIDLAGNTVKSKSTIFNNEIEFNVSNLRTGFYMVKLFNKNKNTVIHKLVIQ